MKIYSNSKNIFLKSKLKRIFLKTLYLLNNHYENLAIGLQFVDEETIRQLNKEHRNVNKITDVLSFPMLNIKAGQKIAEAISDVEKVSGEIYLGDIVICKEKINSQAKEFGLTRKKELVYLALHSFLHLLGYDHMTKEEEKEMYGLAERVLGYGR